MATPEASLHANLTRSIFAVTLLHFARDYAGKARSAQADSSRVHARTSVSPGAIFACCSICVQCCAALTTARSSAASRCRAAHPVCFALTVCSSSTAALLVCALCAEADHHLGRDSCVLLELRTQGRVASREAAAEWGAGALRVLVDAPMLRRCRSVCGPLFVSVCHVGRRESPWRRGSV